MGRDGAMRGRRGNPPPAQESSRSAFSRELVGDEAFADALHRVGRDKLGQAFPLFGVAELADHVFERAESLPFLRVHQLEQLGHGPRLAAQGQVVAGVFGALRLLFVHADEHAGFRADGVGDKGAGFVALPGELPDFVAEAGGSAAGAIVAAGLDEPGHVFALLLDEHPEQAHRVGQEPDALLVGLAEERAGSVLLRPRVGMVIGAPGVARVGARMAEAPALELQHVQRQHPAVFARREGGQDAEPSLADGEAQAALHVFRLENQILERVFLPGLRPGRVGVFVILRGGELDGIAHGNFPFFWVVVMSP
jgi:hypothetical protein